MASKKQELTVRLGLRYFKKLEKKKSDKRIDNQTYILDIEERKNIFKVGRQTVINAFLVGAISSAISTFIMFKFGKNLFGLKDYFNSENTKVLIIIGIVSLITSIFEMIFLFFDTLNKTHKITKAAHLELFPEEDTESYIARSIAKAALELPNPKKSEIGINPRKEAFKTKIILTGIAYKMKVSVSTVILKLIFKKMIGKAIGRAYLSIISIPVIGFWNAYEAWKVVKQVKIRILGPSAVAEFVQNYQIIKKDISYQTELQILRAVASCILSTEDLHPNLEYLYTTLKQQFDINIKNSIIDDTEIFLERLKELTPNEQKFILYVLEFSAIIDGKITKKEKNLLQSAFETCGYGYKSYKSQEALNKFIKGEIINWFDKSLSNIY